MTTSGMSGIRIYDPASANKPKDTNPNTGMSAADQTQNFLTLLIAQIKNQDPMSPMDASTIPRMEVGTNPNLTPLLYMAAT